MDIPSFHLERSESLPLKGPSGSGRTTLLGLLGGVQKPGRGNTRLPGEDLGRLSAAHHDHSRVDHIDYILQQFNLLPFLSVCENTELPYHFSALRRQCAREYHGSPAQAASHLLGQLGLGDELHARRANSLSIDQQQRVAAARALIGQPELVVADEPVSVLGIDSHKVFLQLFFAKCHEADASLLFVSYDQSLTRLLDRSLSLSGLNHAARPAGL